MQFHVDILATRTKHGGNACCFAWQSQERRFVGVEILKEWIRIGKSLDPYVLSE